MKMREFDKEDWNQLRGCEKPSDGSKPRINAKKVVVTDFPKKYEVPSWTDRPSWYTAENFIEDIERRDAWLADPEVNVVVDGLGIGVEMGPNKEEWLSFSCTFDLGLKIAETLGRKISIEALMNLGFQPNNWGCSDEELEDLLA